ncbi:MAG: hypothetical protein ABEN55_04695, partial [Bradymonadaceae bacterium]
MTAVLAGCPSRRTGPTLPDLGEEADRVVRRIERTDRIREVMERDLARATELSNQLTDVSRQVFDGSFPLDLFKHVAVNCLNASAAETVEPSDSSAEPPDDETTGRPRLACKAKFLDRLLRRLDVQAPNRKATAHSILRRVDQFHTLRKRLWRRIAKTSDVLASNRELIASRRADLRKLRQRWKERRPELSKARWNELQKRFQTHAQRIDRLDNRTSKLREASEEWPEQLDRA